MPPHFLGIIILVLTNVDHKSAQFKHKSPIFHYKNEKIGCLAIYGYFRQFAANDK